MSNTQASNFIPVVGVAGLASPLEVGADRAAHLARTLAEILTARGCRVIPLGAIDTPQSAEAAGRRLAAEGADAAALVPACWYEDYLALDLWETWKCPLLVWPTPGMETGALCGTQQLVWLLKRLSIPYRQVFGALDDTACADEAMVFLRAAALHARLRHLRVGVAGMHVNGMTHTAPHEVALKRDIGARVTPIDLPKLLEKASGMEHGTARDLWHDVVGKTGSCTVPEQSGIDAIRFYLALREIIAEKTLDAVAIGCYPHLMGVPCLAASLLADEGIPLACEGDVHGAVAQYILTMLTGLPTHNTDILEPLEDGTFILSHCGSGSFSLAPDRSDIALAPVRLMDRGACALFPARTGAVTMLSLYAGNDGYTCAALDGTAVETEMVFPGNPARIDTGRPAGEVLRWIADEGIPHHWMIGYGTVLPELRAWARIARCRLPECPRVT